MTGSGVGYSPSMKCKSLWHSPAKPVRNSTSRPCGLLIDTSSMVSGWFGACSTAAFIAGSHPQERLMLGRVDGFDQAKGAGQETMAAAPAQPVWYASRWRNQYPVSL